MRIHSTTPKSTVRHHGRTTTMLDTRARRLVGDRDGAVSDLARGDGGYTLAMTALMVVPLMVFLAFAVDLGSWYGQASKVQRAADAAAMAGVVWLPDNAKANTEAQNAARANGVTTGLTYAAVGSNQYQVTITKPATRFFSQVFGQQAFNLTRSAIAQFNKPIPLGSPTAKFGNDIDPAKCPQSQPQIAAPCGPQPMLWSAVNGAYAPFENGDPYSTKCKSGGRSGTGCSTGNPLYRTTGYDYAIDIDAADVGTPITIAAYDVGVYSRSTGNGASGSDCNADSPPFNVSPYSSGGNFVTGFTSNNCQTGDSGTQMNMDFQLYDNDGSDLSISMATPLASCHQLWNTTALNVSATFKNKWVTVCTFTPSVQGIYPIRVRNSGFGSPADAGDGTNAYALKITGGTLSHVYAINDMSIYTNAPGSTSNFYLAEIKPEHAGKKLQIDLYDPGDGNSSTTDYFLQVLAPKAGAPNAVPTSGTVIPLANVASTCKYNATASATKGPATPDSSATCSIKTKNAGSGGGGIYNGKWLRIEVQIDPNYTCNTVAITDCWWTIKYLFGAAGFPTDRTTWSIKVVGDPVHLIQ